MSAVLAEASEPRVAAAARPLLEAVHLGRRFRGLAAVDGVTLDVCVGEIHAVIGTNGAGKSTLVNMLSGELAPTAGGVRFAGADVTRWSQPRRARAGIGRSYQRTTIFGEFSVLENCRLAAQASATHAWRVWQPAARDARGVAIAMCLATSPRALLLDEPLAGMGAEETGRMLDLLVALKDDHAILLIEHDMDAVFKIADRITVMVNGQVIASDVPERIRTDRAVQLAYLGDAH